MKARKTDMRGRNRLTPVPEPEQEATEAQVFEMPVASGNEGAFVLGSFSGIDPEAPTPMLVEDTRANAVIALGLAALSGVVTTLVIVGIVLALT